MKQIYLAAALLMAGMNCMAGDLLTTIPAQNPFPHKAWKVYDAQAEGKTRLWVMDEKRNVNGTVWMALSEVSYEGDYSKTPSGYLYRQEDCKVFRYSEADEREILLFDYGLAVGDKFTDENGRQMEVTAVSDTSFVQPFEETAPSHRCLTLRATDGTSDGDCWIEGLGSLSWGVLGNALPSSGSRSRLMYCDTGNECACFSIGKTDFKAALYEKTASGNEEGKPCYDLLPDGTLCVTGGWYVVCCGTPYLSCRTEGNSVRITDETVGAVCDCMKVYDVNIRIPGFAAGDYTVYLDDKAIPSKQELLGVSVQTADEAFKFMDGKLYSLTEASLSLSIYTLDGMKMYGDKMEGGMSLNLNFLPAGTYCYRIEMLGQVCSGKFVVTGRE